MVSRLARTVYILMNLVVIKINSVNSAECNELFTLFEETSCGSANTTKIKPSLINSYTWNISKHDIYLENISLYEYPPEDCFLELKCDQIETICEEPVPRSTTELTIIDYSTTESSEVEHPSSELIEINDSTTELSEIDHSTTDVVVKTTELITELEIIEMTTEDFNTYFPECRQFITYIEGRSCNMGNSTEVKPVAIEAYDAEHIAGDDPSCPFVPFEDQSLQLICEEVSTVCEKKSLKGTMGGLQSDSSRNNVLIAVGTISAAGVASLLTYFAVEKIKDIMQSGTYYLPK